MKTVVIDLDGTLADITHRLPLVQRKNKDFDSFYAAVGGDTVNAWCREIMSRFWCVGYEVVIVSARRANTETATRKWLTDNKVNFSQLRLLRADGDNTPDQILKMNWLAQYGADNILFVIDDRQKVVDAWRAAGVVCLQCNAWPEYKEKK